MDIRSFFNQPKPSKSRDGGDRSRRRIVDSSDSESEDTKPSASHAKDGLIPTDVDDFFNSKRQRTSPRKKAKMATDAESCSKTNALTDASPTAKAKKTKIKSPPKQETVQSIERGEVVTAKSPKKNKSPEDKPTKGKKDQKSPAKFTKLSPKSPRGVKQVVDDDMRSIVEEEKENKAQANVTSRQRTTDRTVVKPLPADLRRPVKTEDELLWVDKYRPAGLKSVVGQQGAKSCMNKLLHWLRHWEANHGKMADKTKAKKKPDSGPPWGGGGGGANDDGSWAKCALLSGPPGVGKTTMAHLVAKELGFDVCELNASDARSKRALDEKVTDALSCTSLGRAGSKRALLMDEVDGMAGNEDRGGMAELILLIKRSRVPVIAMCNDRHSQKIRSLANHCFDLRVQRPRVDQIKAAMMSICFKEKLKVDNDSLAELIVSCNQDIRQVLHHLSLMAAKQSDDVTPHDGPTKKGTKSGQIKTSIHVGPFDVVRKVFSQSEHASMTLADKSDLYFHDYSLAPLFNHQNYLLVSPAAASGNRAAHLHLIAKAAECLAVGDTLDQTIRSRQAWSLLPTCAMFSSVLPGEYMAGYMQGMIQFPEWFGKYSKRNKSGRQLEEIQSHMSLSVNMNKRDLNEDVLIHVLRAILMPLYNDKLDGVDKAVETMQHYNLAREDIDSMTELSQFSDGFRPDMMRLIDSKVKSALTRQYNKSVVLPYRLKAGGPAKKVKADGPALDYGLVAADDEVQSGGGESDSDAEGDIARSAMIKQVAAKKKTNVKRAATDADGGDVASPAKKARGGQRGSRGGSRGRGRK